jgi:hypothetical protein
LARAKLGLPWVSHRTPRVIQAKQVAAVIIWV